MHWFTAVVHILEGCLLLVIVLGLIHRIFRDYLSREREIEATLVKKHTTTYYRFSIFGKVDSPVRTDYLLEFVSNGKHYCFKDNTLLYEVVAEGQKGTLTYKGGRLIHFEPEEPVTE